MGGIVGSETWEHETHYSTFIFQMPNRSISSYLVDMSKASISKSMLNIQNAFL